ncbi:Uncharacterised protein [Vibrio cholerae]|nr:Uncharacterised protein [Vibrio cholerae]
MLRGYRCQGQSPMQLKYRVLLVKPILDRQKLPTY